MTTTTPLAIDLNGLGSAAYTHSYVLDDTFFSTTSEGAITGGLVTAAVTLCPQHGGYLLEIQLQGKVIVACDRCLGELVLPISAETAYKVRFSDTEVDTEDTIFLPSGEATLALGEYLYEALVLHLPLVKVHEADACDTTMASLLSQYLTTEVTDDEERDDEEDSVH